LLAFLIHFCACLLEYWWHVNAPTTREWARVIKSRWMRWVGHGTHEREGKCIQCTRGENLKEGDWSEDLGVDGKLLKWILN
jgi:hypothetical protein